MRIFSNHFFHPLRFTAMAALLAAPVASATLVGDTIEGAYTVDGETDNLYEVFGSDTAEVGAGTEFEWSSNTGFADVFHELDLARNNLWIIYEANYDSGAAPAFLNFNPHEIWIEDLDWIGMPTGRIDEVTLVESEITGIDWDWTDDSIHFDMPDVAFEESGARIAHFEIETVHDPIPEPATLTLLATGIGCLAVRGSRRAL